MVFVSPRMCLGLVVPIGAKFAACALCPPHGTLEHHNQATHFHFSSSSTTGPKLNQTQPNYRYTQTSKPIEQGLMTPSSGSCSCFLGCTTIFGRRCRHTQQIIIKTNNPTTQHTTGATQFQKQRHKLSSSDRSQDSSNSVRA